MKTQPIHAHFRPLAGAPVTPNFNPSEYVKLGTFPRGDARRYMSRSDLLEFVKCPRRWFNGYKDEGTKSTEWGSLVDCLALTPDRFEHHFAVTPETYEKAGMKCEMCGSVTESLKCAKCKTARVKVVEEKEWDANSNTCREWKKNRESEGREVVKSEAVSEAWKAVRRIEADQRMKAFIAASRKQVLVCVEYHDEDTGIVVPVKCLIDLAPDPKSEFGDTLGDFKTAVDASPRGWTKSVYTYGYDAQAALYLDAMNAVAGTCFTQFAHLVQENFAPYETARRLLDPEFIQIGRAKYRDALAFYCQCLKRGEWPGYDDREDLRGELIDGWRVCSPEPWMIGGPQ